MFVIYNALVPYTGYLALLLRIWVGANFIVHGRPKFSKTGEGIKTSLKNAGLPGGIVSAVGVLELFGGIFLIIGLIVPIVAALLVILFASIILMKKTKQHEAYIAPGKPSYELDVLYLMLAIVILVLGSGVLSVDSLIGF